MQWGCVGGSNFQKKCYAGVPFNSISIMKGWVGVKVLKTKVLCRPNTSMTPRQMKQYRISPVWNIQSGCHRTTIHRQN